MKRSSGPRKTASNLSESVHHQLNMYAVAAGAAGVGVLCFAKPSEARIVYTPAHTIVTLGTSVVLDLNNDHIGDFRLYNSSSVTQSSYVQGMWAESYRFGQGKNRVVATPGPDGEWARALRAGVSIGPAIKPKKQVALMGGRGYNTVKRTTNFGGPWVNGGKGVKNRYLGLKFYISGKVHYGWARITVTLNGNFIVETLTGYAYETIPNRPIITGATKGTDDRNDVEPPNPAALTAPASKPATLGLLAMGAPGLSIWRRKESALQGN